jgi:hypothetical protein
VSIEVDCTSKVDSEFEKDYFKMGSCLSRGTKPESLNQTEMQPPKAGKSQSLSQVEMYLLKAGKSKSLSQSEMCLLKTEVAKMDPLLADHILHIQGSKADTSVVYLAHLSPATCILGGKLIVLSEQHIDYKVGLKVGRYLEDVSKLMSSKKEGEQIDFKELKIIPK